ncbi:hypothetical protein ACSBR1_043691 [Camellia fascicularis]
MGVKASKLAPKGYVPILVGLSSETKRFMVHTTALSDAEFLELLCKSAEEFGFYNEGVLRIPCEAQAFEEMMITNKGSSKQKILRA